LSTIEPMLPQPSDDFQWTQATPGYRLACRSLERVAAHLFTTREWRLGVPDPADPEDGWEDVVRLGDRPGHAARLHQVHGASVVVRRAAERWRGNERPDADIIASDDPGLVLAIQTADCVPLLLADPRTGAAAAAHAGWRGLAAGVPMAAVEALTSAFGSRPSDLIAAVGASIGPCCYEVGPEVREEFERAGFAGVDRWIGRQPRASRSNQRIAGHGGARRGGWFLDMWQAVRDQLVSAGMERAAVHVAELCTASHPEAFWSYRRDGPRTGRMAGAIRPPGSPEMRRD
jgi:polyphenol oxidase